MSIKKQFLKNGSICKVTFKVANGKSLKADDIKLLGDFNNWDHSQESMKHLKNGDFTQTLNLEVGKEYQFRYLVDGVFWDNEIEADKIVPNGIEEGDYNSVLVL